MATYFVLLDAFRGDYISPKTTPYLHYISQNGEYYKRTRQSLGYCERSEIFTGKSGLETGFITALEFKPEHSEYSKPFINKIVRRICSLFSAITGSSDTRKVLRLKKACKNIFLRLLYLKSFKMRSYNIPLDLLHFFALSEDYVDHRESNALPFPSIFDYMRESNINYNYAGFTALGMREELRTDEERFIQVEKSAGDETMSLHLLYISSADKYGHLYGPSSDLFITEMSNLDQRIKSFVQHVESSDDKAKFVFLGDHGMTDVTKKIDIKSIIENICKTNDIVLGRDIVYFLDSTIFRVWFLNDKGWGAKVDIENHSEVIRFGSWMTSANSQHYNIKWPNRSYGDMLWLASPGAMIFPDFFNSIYVPKGMHGYDPSHKDSGGMCIHYGSGISSKNIEEIPLNAVHDILMSSLNKV